MNDSLARTLFSSFDPRGLADTLPLIVWTCDAAGRVEWLNAEWERVTGKPTEESCGARARDAVHPDDLARVSAAWEASLATGAPFEFEYRLRATSGEYRWQLGRVVPLRDAEGRIVRWVATATDIETKKRQEEALRSLQHRFAVSFHANPQPTTITRLADGVYVDVNEAFVEMSGFSREEVVGRSVAELGMWTPEQRAALVAPLLRGERVRVSDVPLRRKDGTYRYVFVSAERIELESVPCILTVGGDLTQQREVEAALRDANRRKDEFLAMLSHELRNPLAPILTALELMRLSGDATFAREREIIERQARHLTTLVDDLLDVSRVARGKITLRKQPVDVRRVVSKALEITAPLFEEKRHALEIAVGRERLVVDGDEVRLVQIVSNLLTNAARYTPDEGHVSVRAAAEEEQVVLRVRDDGVGLAADLLPNVFDPFVQGERRADRAEGGLGIGLALVRSLTTLHGGTVRAHSDGVGKGSEFVVRLPLASASALEAARPAGPVVAAPPAAGTRRVLIVDDNVDAAEMLAVVLGAAGYDVRVAHDGAAALARLANFVPDVAVLDIGLPVMDGYELGAILRQRCGAAMRLVALSGYGQEEDRARSLAAGFEAHLVKPVEMTDLLAALRAGTRQGSTG